MLNTLCVFVCLFVCMCACVCVCVYVCSVCISAVQVGSYIAQAELELIYYVAKDDLGLSALLPLPPECRVLKDVP